MGKMNQRGLDTRRLDGARSFTSLSLFRSGPPLYQDTQLEKQCFSAKFDLEGEVVPLFPLINAVAERAQYYRKPEYIKFMLDGRLFALYRTEGAFTPVSGYSEAFDVLRHVLEYLATIDQRSNEITPNYKKYSPASPLDIFKLLPGTNCRECGYSTCLAFAAALARSYTSFVKCPHFATPVEEQSTYLVSDKEGKQKGTVSLNLDTSDLRREMSQKEQQIKSLQARLATFEQSRAETISEANDKLISPLTKREMEVLGMVALGSTNKEICKQLNISENTVKTHVNHIFDKLNVNDRTQASVWATRNGFL